MAASEGFRARQPGKALWTLIAIAHITIYMLFLSIYYIPKSTRQNPQWTYRNAVTNEFIRIALHHITYVKLLLPLSMELGPENDRFVEMRPESNVYNGVLDNAVKPTVVGGTWYPEAFQTAAAALLIKHIADSALFVQYRLAGNPACPFPAALQDAVTAYQYLLKKGIPASKITISGDSAGGNIAVALLRYIAEQNEAEGESVLPNPAGCALWSPSIDLATQDPKGIDLHRNYKTDYLAGFVLVWGHELYIPKSMEITGPWFSPLRHPFSTKVPIWMMTGKSEVLADTIVDFADRMRSVEGNRIGLYEIPNAPHDVFLVGHVMGWAKEADDAAKAAADYFREERILMTR